MTDPAPISPIRTVSTREGYDLWAAVYDRDGNPLIALEEPRVDEHLGDIRGRTVLDVGCGTGRHALRLAERGAMVTAVDFSEGMLAEARKKPGADRIRFLAHDFAAPLPFGDGAFDRVMCCLVFDHVRDVTALCRELGRVCASDGRIVISVMHPAMMLRGAQARFHDPETGVETRPESVPNQISDYIMGIVRAGLRIEHMSEHFVDDALASQFPRAARYLGWPMLLMLRLSPG